MTSRGLDELLSTSLAVPGTSSQHAVSILTQHFGDDPDGSFLVVMPAEDATERTTELYKGLEQVALSVRDGSVTQLVRAPGFAYAGIDTPLSLQAATAATGPLRAALVRVALGGSEVTGAPALQHDLTPVLQSDLRRGELIALAVGLILLLAALGVSLAVLVPFAVALATSATVLGVLAGLAHATLLVLYVPNLVELIGLGLAIDYSLLIVRRFREELGREGDVESAVLITMATAGRTVVASGTAVAVGLGALLAIPVPFVRSLGLAGLLVPVVSVLAATTLLPALLVLLGRRLRPMQWRTKSADLGGSSGLWDRLGALVARRRVVVLLCALAILASAAIPLAWLALTPVSLSAIPQGSPSAKGLALLVDRVGPGAVSPIELVLDTGRPGEARDRAIEAATLRLAQSLLRQPDVLAVAIGTRPPYLDPTGQYEQVIVAPRADLGAPSTRSLVFALRDRLIAEAHLPPGVTAFVGGAPAQGVDFLARVYGEFPLVVAVIVLVTFLVLLRVFGSLLLAAMAIVLDACSVAASYGLLVVVFRFGVGADVLGLYRVSQIEGWVPVVCFALLFGLTMDYEVFLVSRMREAHERGASTAEAVREGLTSTGKVVSAAALIMVAALFGLVAGHVAGLQELGVGLALGVLVDAAIVRALLLPSLMLLCGNANWWVPRRFPVLVRDKAPPLGRT